MAEVVEFEGALGVKLSARLHRAMGTPVACALFAHCFTCSKESKAASVISSALAQHGITTLRFDFTGLGQSEGEFADTTFSSNVGDIVAAADFLRERHGAPALLIGHSLGGAAVLAAADRVPDAVGVATIGAPFDPEHVLHLLGDGAQTIGTRGEAEVRIGGRPFRIKKQFLDDLGAQPTEQRIKKLRKALVIFHSPQDNIVDIDNARLIYQQARHPKSFVSLDGADHLLRRRADSEYVASVLAAWAGRYLPKEENQMAGTHGEVTVEGGREGYYQQVRAGKHVLSADEPVDVGGTDLGPNPYDFLLAALGTCTSMTMKMYANRKEWPLENVRVTLSHSRIHAKDCEDCASETGFVDIIERTIAMDGPLDDEQRARLMQIADKCPVHKTLTTETKIRSTMA